MKSKIVKMIAQKLGIPIVDIKVSRMPIHEAKGLVVIDEITTKPINPFREIQIGDRVLMEYAKGVVETVYIEEIVDGIAYGVGDDGEEFCAPLANCDKVPF